MFGCKKIKVLVVTYLPWRDDISVGNTLSNIFVGLEDRFEFFSIYFRDDEPDNGIVSRSFQISEKRLVKSIFSRKSVGEEKKNLTHKQNISFSKSYNHVRRMRWDFFLLIQDMIGLFGMWKSPQLDTFIEDIKPDLIFGPLGRVPVSNNLMSFLNRKYNIPLVTYPWDDHYSLNKPSYSPSFWLRTFIERRAIKNAAVRSEFLYTITEQMKVEYGKHFNKTCKLLFKSYDFDEFPSEYIKKNPVKIIFMGNIGSGRWQVISEVVKILSRINTSTAKAELLIYTLSPVTSGMRRSLEIEGTSKLMTPVKTDTILETMRASDILLHVEPTNKKELLFFRLSFSTKLVDYFYSARCILALGGDTESMKYLKKNDAAIVETNTDKIEERIMELINNPDLIKCYAKKAWQCGQENHQKYNIQQMVLNDFLKIVAN